MSRERLTAQDFASDQELRWCPGCGDYSILAQMKKVLPELGLPPERHVFVSGIGCSSRFPYYLNTYGMHTIHGRAPAFATGLKLSHPELQVWVITGDGDGLSIGGNQLIHALRRNLDINILLFNNQIYGLTKGQYSPTSPQGQVSKSTPYGSLETPINALSLALAAEASFVARSVDVLPKHLVATLKAACAHRGTSFVEIYQNCNVFNDGAFEGLTERDHRDERLLRLEHGKAMRFGKALEYGLALDGLELRVVEGASSDDGLLVHDAQRRDTTLAALLATLEPPRFPVPIGVLRAVERPCYEDLVVAQEEDIVEKSGRGTLDELLNTRDCFEVA